jgi:hypothetical protein
MASSSKLTQFGRVPVSTDVLKSVLSNYKAPQAHIRLMEKRGEIIQLRRDLYLCNNEGAYSRMLIANHLLRPSYVSFESALSSYGIIPEAVYTIRSSCLSRSKYFENASGRYEYVQIPNNYYPYGITIGRTEQGYGYLIARPEKAICDLILASSGLRLQSSKAAGEYLEYYLRADMEEVARWDADLLHTIALSAHKKRNDLLNLEKFIRHECS